MLTNDRIFFPDYFFKKKTKKFLIKVNTILLCIQFFTRNLLQS